MLLGLSTGALRGPAEARESLAQLAADGLGPAERKAEGGEDTQNKDTSTV